MILAMWNEEKKAYEFAKFKDSTEAWVSAGICAVLVMACFVGSVFVLFR